MAMRLPRLKDLLGWTGWLIVLGLGLRLYHYGRNPSMWHDEAALVINVLGKSFSELLGPLFFAEAAPPLFLWVEKAVTLVLGESTYALRLFPFLASCVSLLLLVPICHRLLSPRAIPWAILLAACSDQILWHTCEAKPYAVDVLVATVLLFLFTFLSTWPLSRQLLLHSLMAPVFIFLSYPACFLYGGLLAAFLPQIWRERAWKDWLGYGLLIVSVFAAFGLLLAGPAHAQRNETILECWQGSFPAWDKPWTVPLWTFLSSLEVFRYCCEPIGQAYSLLALVGAISLWRRGLYALVMVLTLPILLALAASFVKAYPYGGCRVLVYAAPAVFLLVAAGVPGVLDWLGPRVRRGGAALVLLLLFTAGNALRNAVIPWYRADCAGAATYVLSHRQPADSITANHWEYRYYFRRLGSAFTPLERRVEEPSSRLWMVITDANPQQRLRLAQALGPPNCETVEQREFARTTVFLFAPAEPVRTDLASHRQAR